MGLFSTIKYIQFFLWCTSTDQDVGRNQK